MELSRRDLLKLGLLGTASLYLPVERMARAGDATSLVTLPKPYTSAFKRPPDINLIGNQSTLQMTMRQIDVPYLLGNYSGAPAKTPVWAYVASNGMVNPTIHVANGSIMGDRDCTSYIKFTNGLPTSPHYSEASWTSTHLHGSASQPQFDGYANDITSPGQSKVYTYPNEQGGRTLWYHDHGVHHTAQNAYMGLAAQYHLHDVLEKGLGIPHFDPAAPSKDAFGNAHDNPLIIKDALFKRDGNLLYDDDDQNSLMGDVILVNGVPWPNMKVEARKYRFRILNASISRAYRLSLSDGSPLSVIGGDGGFLPKRVDVTSMRLGMAERYEVIIDFSKYKGRTTPTFVELRGGTGIPNHEDFTHSGKIMRFEVVGTVSNTTGDQNPSTYYSPKSWTDACKFGNEYIAPDEIMGLQEASTTADGKPIKRRTLEFERGNSVWQVNDTTWQDIVSSGYKRVVADPSPNSIEIWDLYNSSGGWFHPVHLHLVDFKILSRNGRPPHPYEMGPKDTAYVGEGERVRVAIKFGPQQGYYMIHCHNLAHEDHDMMAQFRVGPEQPMTHRDHPMNPANRAN